MRLLSLLLLTLLCSCGKGPNVTTNAPTCVERPYTPDGRGNVVCSVYALPSSTTALPDYDSLDEINHHNDMRWESIDIAPSSPSDKFTPFIGGEFDNLKTNFGVRCGTRIVIPQTGNYTFTLESEDGSKLFIDGAEIIDNDGVHSYQARSGTVVLNAGNHKLHLKSFVGSNGKGLTLSWSFNGGPTTVIPASQYTLNR